MKSNPFSKNINCPVFNIFSFLQTSWFGTIILKFHRLVVYAILHLFTVCNPFYFFYVGNFQKRSFITQSLMDKMADNNEAYQHSDLICYYLGCLSFVCHEVNSHFWAFIPLTCVSDLAATLSIDHSICAEFLSALQMGERFNSPPRLQEACHTHRCSHLQTITRFGDIGSHQWWVFWLNTQI